MRLCNWFAGIDINSRAIIATIGSSVDGEAAMLNAAAAFEPTRAGTPLMVDELTQRDAIVRAGEWLRLQTGGSLQEVALTIAGKQIQEVPSSGECRFQTPMLIDQEMIESTRRQALHGPALIGPVLCSAVRTYVLDDIRTTTAPIGARASFFRVEVVAWVAQARQIRASAEMLAEAGYRPGVIAPRAVAIAEAASTKNERENGVLVISVNDEATEAAAFLDSNLVDLFVVPLGKNALEAQFARGCSVSVAVARRLDLNRIVNATTDEPVVQRVRNIYSAWSKALCTAIMRRLAERDLAWRLQAGIVIADSARALPELAVHAARVIGAPARYAVSPIALAPGRALLCEPLAAAGMIPLQWNASRATRLPFEATHSGVMLAQSAEAISPLDRRRRGSAIGRWLREFVPADHSP